MCKRTIKQVSDAMWSALKKWYVGEGLYINIDQVIINEPFIEDEAITGVPAESYQVIGTYGRYDPNGDDSINFQCSFSLTYTDDDADEFIAGMFYHIMCQNEGTDQ